MDNYRTLVQALSAPVSEVRKRFNSMSHTEVDFLHACIGISTEAGELLDVSKKVLIYGQWMDSHRENIKEELGDILFYLELACSSMGVSIEDMQNKNRTKLLKRYSDGTFSHQAASARADKVGDL